MSDTDITCPRCGSDDVDAVDNPHFPEATHGCGDCLFLGVIRNGTLTVP